MARPTAAQLFAWLQECGAEVAMIDGLYCCEPLMQHELQFVVDKVIDYINEAPTALLPDVSETDYKIRQLSLQVAKLTVENASLREDLQAALWSESCI